MAAAFVAQVTTFTTTAGNKTATITPAIGERLIVVTAHTGFATAATVTDDQGGTYTELDFTFKNASADRQAVWARAQLVTSAVAHIVTSAAAGSSGGGLSVLRFTGLPRNAASGLLKQAGAKQANQTVNGIPAPVLGAAANTTSALIGAVFTSLSSSTTFTAPTGFSERFENGYSTPATGLEVVTADSGFTGTTITWAAGSATQPWCSLVVELDSSSPTIVPRLITPRIRY